MTTETKPQKTKYRVFMNSHRVYSRVFEASSESEAMDKSHKHMDAMNPNVEHPFDWRLAGWRFEPDWSYEEAEGCDINAKNYSFNSGFVTYPDGADTKK